MPLLDCFTIVKNEEELISYCLESYCSIADLLGVVSIVDNDSTDSTLDIIDSYKDRLPIVVQNERSHAHHGHMRNLALSICKSPWILYLDGDETFTSDMRGYLDNQEMEPFSMVYFYKYTTIVDRFHYVDGGNGYTQRLFRNIPGTHFPQSIHTEPTFPPGTLFREDRRSGPWLFDHTACKSQEALWAKGVRYAWAAREKVPAIGPFHEYIGRVEDAMINHPENNKEFPPHIRSRIFSGP